MDDARGSWSGTRVLVTGGAGNLGSNIVSHLLSRGARVTSFDVRQSAAAGKTQSVVGDICDRAALEAA